MKRQSLLRKYALIFGSLVTGSLLVSGLIGNYIAYQQSKAALITLQQEKADAATRWIGQYLIDLEQKIAFTSEPRPGLGPLAQRISEIELLRQVPAISEVVLLDRHGKEQLHTSRLGQDVLHSGRDYSQEDVFRKVKSGKPYRSQVYFMHDTEPGMTIAMAVGPQDAGVTVVYINLEFLLDGISRIKVGQAGYTYAVSAEGQLIAHPDLGLVLKKTNFSSLPQFQAARRRLATHVRGIGAASLPASIPADVQARDLSGQPMLSAYGAIAPLGWLVFVEQPQAEAFAPLYAAIMRTGFLLLVGLVVSLWLSMLLVRRMVGPIRALKEGASLIGAGSLDQRIVVNTGDELEELAEQFNRMAYQLRESYSDLEQKVCARTAEVVQQKQTIENAKLAQQTILDNAIAGIAFSRDGMILQCNRGMEDLLGYASGELIGKPNRCCFASDAAYQQFRKACYPTLVSGQRWSCEWEFVRKDGSSIICLYHATALEVQVDAKQLSKGVISEMQDITARKQADAALLDTKNGLERSLAELASQKEQVELAHRNIAALSEIGREITASLDREDIMRTLYQHVRQLMGVDGFAIGFYRKAEGLIEFPFAMICERRLDPYKRSMSEPNQLAVWCVTHRAEIFINDRNAQISDYIHSLNLPLEENLFGLQEDAMPQSGLYMPMILKEKVVGLIAVQHFDKQVYQRFHLDILRTFASYAAVALDNADTYRQLQSAQQQLVFQEKMASLGTLTAGVAHEINNPANFAHVGAYNMGIELAQFHRYLLELAGEDAPPELLAGLDGKFAALSSHLATIREGTMRIRDLVKDLRTFSRLDEAERKAVPIADSLRSTVNLVRMQYVDSTEIRCQLDANPIFECWPAQLNQVFMNLIVNACQAIEEYQQRHGRSRPGVLTIRSRIDGQWLVLEFEDNGGGMPQSTIDHIFEPFFTTKTVGDGMGMGLSISFRIIEKHNGTIVVTSVVGEGTCFTLRLPLAASGAAG
jgi:PAS domain S-box-containing protein